ncbi:MAG: CPBP family intramembrane metalloprotease [Oscillospiraceae bacterium]|nr:CPBP family intramembrane metalloprotease [Oscillospiraceae bacterium]
MTEQEEIDVIESFDYDCVNQQYGKDYLYWRRRTKEPFIYRFTGNARESVYTVNSSPLRQNAAAAERTALGKCSEKIGLALLIFMVCELVGVSLFVALLHLIHIDIRIDFLTLKMNGSQWAVVGVRALLLTLKYLLPTVLLVRLCHIPQSIYAPAAPNGLPEHIAAAAGGLMIAGIYSLTAQNLGIETAQILFTYKDMGAIYAYGLFDAIVGAVLAELLLRGTILPLLRQFGEPFAIVMTAVIAFLCPNKLPDRISELLIGLAAGYLMIRSGSIFKGVLLRMIYTALSYARLVVLYTSRSLRLWEYALLLISVGMLAAAFYFSIRKSQLRLRNNRTALSEPAKTAALIQSITALPWFAASVLLTLFQLFY